MDKRDLIRSTADLIAPLAIDAPSQHWLNSDATFSYCWPCARKAAWAEVGDGGECPAEPERTWENNKVEEKIAEAIDGGTWYSGTSDTPQSCETCGCTLSFSLTAYGVEYTLEGFEADSLMLDNLANPSCVYELKEMFDGIENIEDDNQALLDAIYDSAVMVRQLLDEPYTPPPERIAA